MGLTFKTAMANTMTSVHSFYNDHIANTTIYQQVKASDVYKNMSSLMNDISESSKIGFETFKNSESGQKAVEMSKQVQATEEFQSLKQSFSTGITTIGNMDVEVVTNKTKDYAARAEHAFGTMFQSDTPSNESEFV